MALINLLLATQLIFSWVPNPANATNGWNASCSATVKTSCVSGYWLLETTNPANPFIAGIPAYAKTYTLTPLPSPGVHTYALQANGINAQGAMVHSTKALVTVTVP